MPNLYAALKSEISRVARKELRTELDPLRKTLAQYRATLSALKREVAALERRARKASRVNRTQARQSEVKASETQPVVQRRFSAQRLAAHRAKLGLSAASYAKLAGVSALSVYKWESGTVRPRPSQVEALASVRKLTSAEVQERLGAR